MRQSMLMGTILMILLLSMRQTRCPLMTNWSTSSTTAFTWSTNPPPSTSPTVQLSNPKFLCRHKFFKLKHDTLYSSSFSNTCTNIVTLFSLIFCSCLMFCTWLAKYIWLVNRYKIIWSNVLSSITTLDPYQSNYMILSLVGPLLLRL